MEFILPLRDEEVAADLLKEIMAMRLLSAPKQHISFKASGFYEPILGKKNLRGFQVFDRGFHIIACRSKDMTYTAVYKKGESFIRLKDSYGRITHLTALRRVIGDKVRIIMPGISYEFLRREKAAVDELAIHELFEENFPNLGEKEWELLSAAGIGNRSDTPHQIAENLERFHTAQLARKKLDLTGMSILDWKIALFSYLLTGEKAVSSTEEAFKQEIQRRISTDIKALTQEIDQVSEIAGKIATGAGQNKLNFDLLIDLSRDARDQLKAEAPATRPSKGSIPPARRFQRYLHIRKIDSSA